MCSRSLVPQARIIKCATAHSKPLRVPDRTHAEGFYYFPVENKRMVRESETQRITLRQYSNIRLTIEHFCGTLSKESLDSDTEGRFLMVTILAPLSRSIDPDGQPDAEACARCD